MKFLCAILGVCMLLGCSKEKLKGQNLKFCLKKDPVTLDPRLGNDMVASQLHFMLFEGLVRLNPDLSISAAQAESFEVSEDGKFYTFHLGKTRWSDGQKVTAFDFEKSWKSLLDPNFPTPDSYLLYPIKNAKLAKQGKVLLDEVGIHSKTENTLLIELESPTPYFLQIVASSVLLPVRSQEKITKDLFPTNGPFTLKYWRRGQELFFEKNPLYRNAQAVKLKTISMEIIERELPALHMYASGHFDLIGAPLSFFPIALHQDLEQKQLLRYFPVAATKFLAFNTQNSPLKNVNLRRAFSLSVNRESIIENITQLGEKIALNPIPEILLHQDNQKDPQNFCSEQKNLASQAKIYFDLALKESKEDLSSITLMYVFSEINHLIAQALQDQWLKTLGVKVNLEQVDFKTLHERSEKGNFSIGIFAWLADYADPMNIVERFQEKNNHRNYSKWENLEYAQCILEAHQAKDREQYLSKIKCAEKILVDQMPITGLFHENFTFLIHPHVKNFAISPLGHIYFDQIAVN